MANVKKLVILPWTPSPDLKRKKTSMFQSSFPVWKGLKLSKEQLGVEKRLDEYLNDYYSNPNNPPLSICGVARIRKRLMEESPTDILNSFSSK
jgi:hypothetical protein